jgi:hypothetical protein
MLIALGFCSMGCVVEGGAKFNKKVKIGEVI